MAHVADETGLLLVEAFHYRYHPLADRVHELIRNGAIGKPPACRRTFFGADPAGQYPLRLEPGWRRDDGSRMLSAAHDSLLLGHDAARHCAPRRKWVRPTSTSRWRPIWNSRPA